MVAGPLVVVIETFDVPFTMLVIDAVVCNSRTLIVSPTSGAPVNINAVPDTVYAVVGNCTTPFIETITESVVKVAEPNVNDVVVPSPVNVSVVIIVNDDPTVAHSVPVYCSRLLLTVLNRIIPATPVAGRCIVVPVGTSKDEVALNATKAPVVCVALPKLAVFVPAST